MGIGRSWHSFRLRDLFVLVTIAAVAGALGAPYIASSWVRQRRDRCENNLRQIGLAFHEFSDRDPAGRFCTGAPDFLYDGSPDTFGWVADVIHARPQLRPVPFCPNSPATGTATYNDLLSKSTVSAKGNVPSRRYYYGGCAGMRSITPQPGSEFGGTVPGTPARAEFVRREFWERGYNTNYVASWPLVRTQPKIVRPPPYTQTLFQDPGMDGWRSLDASSGPMTRRHAGSAPVPSGNIPFLGCGSASESLTANFGNREHRLVPSMNPGPIQWSAKSRELPAARGDLDAEVAFAAISAANPPSPVLGSAYALHDTRGWAAYHRDGWYKQLNLLMADGSVKSLPDVNGDGYLNPGFPVPSSLSPRDYVKTKYRDSTVELPRNEVWSGLLLYRLTKSICTF